MGISGGRRKKKERKKGDTVRKPSELVLEKGSSTIRAVSRFAVALPWSLLRVLEAREHRVCVLRVATKIDRFGSLDACNGQGLEYSESRVSFEPFNLTLCSLCRVWHSSSVSRVASTLSSHIWRECFHADIQSYSARVQNGVWVFSNRDKSSGRRAWKKL